MKKLLILVAAIFISIQLFAQAPQKMSYQAVIRNASNNLVTNAPVKMRISVLQGSATGTSVYSELHSATTNANGLVSIEIGNGTSQQGNFSNINWGNGTYFLKTETDPNNGTSYSIVGTSQLLSVPYALEANNAKNAGNGIKEVSKTGDTVYLDNGKKYIIPGIKDLNPPSTINNGLVGFWPFNGNANDESGNGNNGIVNGATLTTDRFSNANKAYSFDGKSLIKIIKNNILEPKNELSLVCWINPNYSQNQGSDASNSATQIIRKGAAFDNGYHLNWSNLDNRKIESRYYASWGNIVHGPPNESYKNSWNCVVMTYSKLTNESKLYINEMTVSSAPCSNILEHSDDMYIGGFKDFQFFNGKIDDIRIYNRALTQEEITWLANN